MRYSPSEFESIYHKFFPPAMRTALCLLHDEDEARDIVQGVFMKLWESDTKIENPLSFIVRAVKNASLDRLKSLDTKKKIESRLLLEPPPEESYLDPRYEDVNHAIKRLLTPREKQIVEKIFDEGKSYKETAESLRITVSAVNKNVVSALRKLRTHFKSAKS